MRRSVAPREPLPRGGNGYRVPRGIAATGVVLLVATAVLGRVIHARVEETIRQQAEAVLSATANAAADSVQARLSSARRLAAVVASDDDVEEHAQACGADAASACESLMRALRRYARLDHVAGVRFVDAAGVVRASEPAQGAAVDAALLGGLARVSAGHAVFGDAERNGTFWHLPIASPVTSGPLRAGAVVLDYDLRGIDALVRSARVGRSGETYLFDRRARMLTRSRFEAQLRAAGLLPAEGAGALGVELRDPGVDLTREPRSRRAGEAPLTRMAARALAGQTGVDLDGYRDYRGVPVIGTYRALGQSGLYLATEIDVADAYRSLRVLQRMFAGLLGVLALALTAAIAIALRSGRLRQRARAAEQRAERFGQYTLESKLGEGGMSVVYGARHALLRRRAAIKLLRPERITAEAQARFEHEAQVTSALTHPNTIEIFDFGRTDAGALYYVMEYLEGLDLQRMVLAFGPLPQARVLHFLRQACGSLAEAHAAGLVHRDIKPANLFVCTRGGMLDTLKVLDFGIVHVVREAPAAGDLVMGTPEYMAPELFESGSSASAQSDLYALGVVACFLLTGELPFAGSSTRELSLAHLTQEPPSLTLPSGEPLDPTLDAAVSACLAKRTASRPASASSLGALLARSALAGRWTQGDARAFWDEHRDAIADLSASSPPSTGVERVRVSTLA